MSAGTSAAREEAEAAPDRKGVAPAHASFLLSRAALWLLPLAFLAAFFFLPLIRILAFSLRADTLTASNLRLVSATLGFTVYQAVLSTLLTLTIGLPSAVLFARFRFPGRSLLHALTAVPFMLPTVVVAAGFNALLGPRGWANLVLMRSLGLVTPPIAFVGTLGAILLAHVFYNTTIVIRLVEAALSGLDPKLAQAARSLGADSRRVWWKVILPLLRAPLFAATLLVFLFDFTSFGVVLLLGGPHFATLEVQIYVEALSLLNLPVASLLALIQLLCTIGFSVLYTRMAGTRPCPNGAACGRIQSSAGSDDGRGAFRHQRGTCACGLLCASHASASPSLGLTPGCGSRRAHGIPAGLHDRLLF